MTAVHRMRRDDETLLFLREVWMPHATRIGLRATARLAIACAMLRVLTLSSLFPNRSQPTLGIFVERQTLALAVRDDVALEVVAPIGLPAWPLSRHGHYRARAALPEQEEWKGVTVHRPRYPVAPVIGHRWTAGWMAKALLPRLREIRIRFPFDVIDTEFFWPDGPAAMRLAAALEVPFLIKARGSDINWWGDRPSIRRQLLEAAAKADRLLAVSAALKANMVEMGMPSGRISIHYTGVDLDRFAPADRAAAKARLGVSGPLLLCVGALVPVKGQQLALDALALIPGATLVFAGDGPERGKLEKYAAALALSERVRFAGVLPQAEIAQLMAAADVMMLPSKSEGLANAWIEAMASGTPVVTADVGGAREAIRAGAGHIVARTPEAFAEAARELIRHPLDQWDVRRSAERFSWDTNSQELYRHLAAIAGP